MKRVLGILAIAASIYMPASAKGLIKPANVAPGDTIAIISMASTPDSAYVTAAVKVFADWGYVPVVGKYVLAEHGTFAGTPEQRLEDLKWAFDNSNVKAVMSTRGGYGSVQELALLPRDYFKKHNKWLIGYSDISAVHSSMATDGVMSVHGHMAEYLMHHNGTDSLSGWLRQIIETGSISYTIKNNNPMNHQGTASGVLFGGNLSVLNDIAQTPIDYLANNAKNLILFIEDVDENIQSISRILYRLKYAGILGKVKGLIIGQFTGYKPSKDYETMEAMIYDIVNDMNIPIVYDFPVGHVDNNYPLIQGSNATLTVTETTVTLTME
ncbi:MAG: LD-carboxypeptidase [Muribaculaceae bacterium]|nr:LD-carboxypeptidase [Muribaculaceae bacterium]